MKLIKFKTLKKILLFTFLTLLTASITTAVIFKIKTPYLVSIYNYESYLSKPLIAKINKKYSYRVFNDINVFTKDIEQGKTVGGVGSDFQIANLVLEGKIKKINWNILIDNLSNNREEKKQQIQNIFTDITNSHIEKYENWIINKIIEINPENNKNRDSFNHVIKPFLYYKNENLSNKNSRENILGFEVDSEEGIDNFYEFLIPYFIQDKVVAYNINKNSRPHITNWNSEKYFNSRTWKNIYETLYNLGYHKFGWTNVYYDNLMLGQYFASEENKHNYLTENGLANINLNNIDNIIEYFKEFVFSTTHHSILETKFNKLATNGLELVNDLIDPSKEKLDAALMYNGDVLDSYYSNDNFSMLEDGKNVDYIRPQNNMILLDAWIISKSVSDSDSDAMLKYLKEVVFDTIGYSYNELVSAYYNNILNNFDNKESLRSKLFTNNIPKTISELDTEFFTQNFEKFKDFDFSNMLSNFDNVNYTPTIKNEFNFFKDYYFLDENKEVDIKAKNIYNINIDEDIYYSFYVPLDKEVKSTVIKKYFEKTHS
ncbi:hypothetical protein N8G13_03110 [Mycoplasma zalophi]|uniref:hypothetical protein n=1 Tax=Mycoplasma zalophi TaxID=191287 RepID=UPI0021C62BE6|nr:hypothetical protein [Mycoplasma zalophi]MCU4117430.1 hypothetical protein [Mycoplasma zalophi]